MYALVDCNNFFVSCERAFNPKLVGKPVIVLSNNDGCAIARSNEAKALGIGMGAKKWEIQSIITQYDVQCFSSNFILYADMSQRVFETLSTFGLPIEVYSIDEAFIHFPKEGCEKLALDVSEKVYKWTGLPVTVGVGRTKTLAKVAVNLAKKQGLKSFVLEETAPIFEKLDVVDVWGIGHRLAKRLYSNGVRTVGQLVKRDDGWIKKKLTTVGLQTVYELRGTPCLRVEEEEVTRKSFLLSRTLRIATSNYDILKEKVAHFIARLASKLRKKGLKASYVTVFLEGGRRDSSYLVLKEATAYTPLLIQVAHQIFDTIYDERMLYKRVGVMVAELSSETVHQLNLYGGHPEKEALMQIVDQINDKYDRTLLHFAAEGLNPGIRSSQDSLSSRFTTSWDELLEIDINR